MNKLTTAHITKALLLLSLSFFILLASTSYALSSVNTQSATGSRAKKPTKTPTPTPTPSIYVQVISPNGGETLTVGKTYRITWKSTPNIDTVSIGYSACPSCLDWIATGIHNTNYYDWNVFVGNTTNTQFKIWMIGYYTGQGSYVDESDNYFTVQPSTQSATFR